MSWRFAILVWILTMSFIIRARAQEEDLKGLRFNEGKMFTLQIVPKSRKLVVSVVGKPAAEVEPGRVVILGKEINPKGETRTLQIRPSGAHFELVDKLSEKSQVEIEVKDTKSQKSEVFQLQR